MSAAQAWIDAPVAKLPGLFLAELGRVLPATRTAVVRDFFVTRERSATFRPAPGSAAHRLPTRTPATESGLVLAGAWTDTGWPATMEGAVRSGVAAASVLAELSNPARPDGGMGSTPSRLTRHDGSDQSHTHSTANERAGHVETAEEALA